MKSVFVFSSEIQQIAIFGAPFIVVFGIRAVIIGTPPYFNFESHLLSLKNASQFCLGRTITETVITRLLDDKFGSE